MSEVNEVPFSAEPLIYVKHSFYKILLEAIDDAEPVANKENRKQPKRGF